MLTELQKEDIAAKLKQKHDAYNKLIFDLGSLMFKTSRNFNMQNIVHYDKTSLFKDCIEKFKGNLLGMHYYSGSVVFRDGKIDDLHIYVYLNNTTKDCTGGYGQCVGWSGYGQCIGWKRGEDGGISYYCSSEKWLCQSIGLDQHDTIREFVFKNADTNPFAIVKVSKWLDLPFKRELVKMVECFINESSKAYALAANEAAYVEARNDNILLEEFGLKNVATPIKAKSYKLTLKEIAEK